MRRTFAARTGALLAMAALATCTPESQPDAVVVEVPPAAEEMAGGVDPITRRQFWELIYELSGEGVTVFDSQGKKLGVNLQIIMLQGL